MKRKKLLQFADWLEKSRRPFDIASTCRCVAYHAGVFDGDTMYGGCRPSRHIDLVHIFDMSHHNAEVVYSGFNWGRARSITRKVAANMIRKLARTGSADWGKYNERPC